MQSQEGKKVEAWLPDTKKHPGHEYITRGVQTDLQHLSSEPEWLH